MLIRADGRPDGPAPPLFMVHGALGAIASKSAMADMIDADCPLYFVNARGFEGAPPYRDVPEMASAYAAAIQGFRPSGGFHVAGLCPGGIVALEVARRLRAADRAPQSLILIDPGPSPMRSPASLRKLDEAMSRPGTRQQMREETLNSIRVQLVNAGLAPFDAGDPIQLDRAVEIGIDTALAIARHAPAPYDGPVAVVTSANNARNFFDPAHSWQSVLAGPRILHVLPGNHMTMLHEQRKAIRMALRAHVRAPQR